MRSKHTHTHTFSTFLIAPLSSLWLCFCVSKYIDITESKLKKKKSYLFTLSDISMNFDHTITAKLTNSFHIFAHVAYPLFQLSQSLKVESFYILHCSLISTFAQQGILNIQTFAHQGLLKIQTTPAL